VTLLAFPSLRERIRLDRSQYLPQEAYDQFLRANGETVFHVSGEMDIS
jgi:hypothetical protein